MDNKCVCCDAIIPEGRQVCPSCENKKLIYADDLFAVLRDDINISGSNLAKVRRHIAEAPAVDAVEVVHGRWVDATHIDEDFGEVESYECSVCGRWEYYTPNYCPNCGAKMDGDGNG